MAVGLTIYILIFPAVAAVTLAVIWTASIREYLEARRNHEDLV